MTSLDSIKASTKKETKTIDKAEKEEEQKDKKRGLSRKERLNIKKQQKEERKRLKQINREGIFTAPSIGYTFSPSYIKSGSRYGTILRITNKYGQNRNLNYGWMAELIPKITQRGVRAYMFETDKAASRLVQDAMMKEIGKSISSMNDSLGESEMTDDNIEDLKTCAVNDLRNANILLNRDESVIDFRLRILLVSDDPDKLAYEVQRLQDMQYNSDNLRGIRLAGQGGDQRRYLSQLYSPPIEEDKDEETAISSRFAGNDHFVRKGLSDKTGIPIGRLTESYSAGEALMDLDSSFSFNFPANKGKVLVACPEDCGNGVTDIGMNHYPGASLWGQLIANNVIMNGKNRVFHIVLNHFYYGYDDNDYFVSPSFENIVKRYDMSKGGVNPLEMYSNHSNLGSVFNASVSKIAKEFDLLSNDELTREERLILEKLLKEFYISKRLWDRKADKNNLLARAINPTQHKDYVTFGSFVNELSNLVNANKNDDFATEKDRDTAKFLKNLLENAIDSHSAIFNETTSIDIDNVRKYRQSYFDLSELDREQNVMEAQFLNVFDFVSYFARKNDVIMIHGLDKISVDTLTYLSHSIKALESNKVRFVYLLDEIGGNTQLAQAHNTKVRCDLFSIENLLYRNLDLSFDYTILGTMNEKELIMYKQLLGIKDLPENIEEALTKGGQYNYQIRRMSDATSSFVLGEFVI